MADPSFPNVNSMSPFQIITQGGLKNAPQPPRPDSISSAGDLTFPADLQNYRFHITFDFRKWMRRSIKDRTFFSAQGNLRLPIPANMVDNNQVQWGIEGNDPIVGALIDAAAASGIANSTSGGDAVDRAKDLIGKAAAAAPGALAAQLATGIFGTTNTSQALALFGKRHTFSWRLSPQNADETERLVRIAAMFRQHMYPSLTNWPGGTLLNYPDICLVTLYPADKYLYKFKPCVVTDCAINYAPNTPAFFRDTSAPMEIILTVNLLEVEYWIAEDVAATWNRNSDPNGQIFVWTDLT